MLFWLFDSGETSLLLATAFLLLSRGGVVITGSYTESRFELRLVLRGKGLMD